MTIVTKVGGRWFGETADGRPTLGTEQTGHEFYDTDTFEKFFWNGTEWVLSGTTPFDLTQLKTYWKFNEASAPIFEQANAVGSVDGLGTPADLSIPNGATAFNVNVGPFGHAIQFDGSNEQGRAGTSNTQFDFMSTNNGVFTFNVWFRLLAASQGTNYFWSTQSSSTGMFIQIRNGTGNNYTIRIQMNGSENIDFVDVGDYTDITNFHMLSVQWNDNGGLNNALCYLDNNAPVLFTQAITNTTSAQREGRINERGGQTLNAYYTEVSIFKRLLTADEVSALYNNGNGLEL